MKNKKTTPPNQQRRSSAIQNGHRQKDDRSFAERTPMDLTGRYSQDYLARQEDDGYHQKRMGGAAQGKEFNKDASEEARRRTDETICDEVYEALAQHPEVEDRHIHVDVKSSVCTLTGWVSSDQMRRQAETCCRMVSGISRVHNQLELSSERRPTGFSSGSEAQSAER